MATVVERVSKGAGYLNGRLGEGWQQYVDLESLNMGSRSRCLLAQLSRLHPQLRGETEGGHGQYVHVLEVLGKNSVWATEHGFEAEAECTSPAGTRGCTCGPEYAALNQAWKDLLLAV